MTRDDVSGPAAEKKPIRVARRGPDGREGRFGSCFGTQLRALLFLPPCGITLSEETGLCITYPYINMSSSRARAKKPSRSELNPLPFPIHPRLTPCPPRAESKHAFRHRARRRTTWTRLFPRPSLHPPFPRPVKSPLAFDSTSCPRPGSSRGRFRLLAPDIAGNSSRGFAPGRFIDGTITSGPCLLDRLPSPPSSPRVAHGRSPRSSSFSAESA